MNWQRTLGLTWCLLIVPILLLGGLSSIDDPGGAGWLSVGGILLLVLGAIAGLTAKKGKQPLLIDIIVLLPFLSLIHFVLSLEFY